MTATTPKPTTPPPAEDTNPTANPQQQQQQQQQQLHDNNPFTSGFESDAAAAAAFSTTSNPSNLDLDNAPITTPTTAATPKTPPPTAATVVEPQEGQRQEEPGQEPGREREQVPEQTPPADPRIAPLKAMFPDYDETILLEVLSSVGGNQDRAIDTLLGMSDPDYFSEPTAAHTEHTGTMSQTELDEQLARRLVLEEEEEHRAAWQAQEEARRQQQQQQPRPHSQQRPGFSFGGGGHQSPSQGGDTMAEIQQQLGKFAESGKKTFGNIFSKVKAKIQEMDQPKTPSTQPNWGGGSSGGYDPAGYEHQVYQNQQHPVQQSYETQQSHHNQGPTSASAYDTSDTPQLPPVNIAPSPSPPIALHNARDAAPDSTRSAASPPTNETPRPPTTGSGIGGTSAPIDGGKLGLLPKQPVSLLRPGAVQKTHSQSSSHDDGDDLEYAESPFEEPKNAGRK